jgi:N-acetylmuramoyl-L-alanine amidase
MRAGVLCGIGVCLCAWSVLAPVVPARAQVGGTGGASAPGLVIVIDAGHGGDDPGTVGSSGTEEKAVTFAVAQRMRAALLSRGVSRVVLTREDDRRLSLIQRAEVANAVRADVFISLHVNASPSPETRGPEAASIDELNAGPIPSGAMDSRAPASLPAVGFRRVQVVRWDAVQRTHAARAAAMAQRVGDALQKLTPLGPRRVFRAPMRVLSGVDAPAVLIELGYLSNGEDEDALGRDEYQGRLADALVEAIVGLTPGAR